MKPKLLNSLLAAAFFVASTTTYAAGLGKLTVLSALGQPLRAEIDLMSVEKEELASLSARVASPEAYQQAGIEYNSALPYVKLSVEKRPSGQHYLKITSTQAVNEPFLDLLVELNSSSGKLLREYTVLMDPPGAPRSAPVGPIATQAGAKPEEPTKAAEVVSPAEAPSGKSAPNTVAAATGDSYGPVKEGDTLSKIARNVKPDGVNLDQMLVGLFRSNPDAFAEKNMNRLKTGKILRVPEASELDAVDERQASREVKLQASNWNAYRARLAEAAAAAPADEAPKQVASGRITTQVEDQAAADAGKDVLKLSKADTGGTIKTAAAGGKGAKALQEKIKALEEEVTARDKALQESNERVAMLEKSVKDMQKLLEIKSPAGADMQKQAAATAATVAAPKPDEAPKPTGTANPAETAAPTDAGRPSGADRSEDKSAVAPADTPAEAKPAEGAVPGEQAAAAPKPKVVSPAPPLEQPSFVNTLMEEPIYLAGGAGVLALLGGIFFANRRKKKALGASPEPDAALDAHLPQSSVSAPSSAFAVGPTEVKGRSDEMDPVDEATKYLALGRDSQAEEILKEALKSHPGRPELLLKLLEVHSGRKDKRALQTTAQELFAATSGTGDIWIQAARLGYGLDPQNSLYSAGRSGTGVMTATSVAAAGTTTSDLDFDLDVVAPKGPTETDITLDATTAAREVERTMLMRDQELRQVVHQAGLTGTQQAVAVVGGTSIAMTDFNLATGSDVVSTSVSLDVSQGDANGLDINFEVPLDALATAPAMKGATDIKLDLNRPAPTPTSSDIVDFDLSGISLDLDGGSGAAGTAPASPMKDDHWFDVQTKFDLAKAYQEMGDKESAREILQEVIQEGDAQQLAEAKTLLQALV